MRHRSCRYVCYPAHDRFVFPGIERLTNRLDPLDAFRLERRAHLSLDQENPLGPIGRFQVIRNVLNGSLEIVERRELTDNGVGSGPPGLVASLLLDPPLVVDKIGLRALRKVQIGTRAPLRLLELSLEIGNISRPTRLPAQPDSTSQPLLYPDSCRSRS